MSCQKDLKKSTQSLLSDVLNADHVKSVVMTFSYHTVISLKSVVDDFLACEVFHLTLLNLL